MAKIPFDVKYRPQIESGEYRIETKDGRLVEIVKWDLRSPHGSAPILAIIHSDDYDCHRTYSDRGYSMSDSDRLFIVTPEEELTLFENRLCEILDSAINYQIHSTHEKIIEDAKELAPELLSLATEELKKKFVLLHKDDYQTAFDLGKAESLKDLPGWKKIDEADNACVREPHVGTNMVGEKMLYIGNHAMSISSLEKLPGFKED